MSGSGIYHDEDGKGEWRCEHGWWPYLWQSEQSTEEGRKWAENCRWDDNPQSRLGKSIPDMGQALQSILRGQGTAKLPGWVVNGKKERAGGRSLQCLTKRKWLQLLLWEGRTQCLVPDPRRKTKVVLVCVEEHSDSGSLGTAGRGSEMEKG